MPEIDIHKILRDLEMKAVGVDPATQEMQEVISCPSAT
jgi:hypothetical protein